MTDGKQEDFVPSRYYSHICLEGLQKTKVQNDPADILTRYFPHINVQHHYQLNHCDNNTTWTWNKYMRVNVKSTNKYLHYLTTLVSYMWVQSTGWNVNARRKPKYSQKNLSWCHFVHHKSSMHWSGIKPGPPQWQASNSPDPLHGLSAAGILLLYTCISCPCAYNSKLTLFIWSTVL